MFDSLIYSLTAVAPILILILLGNILSRKMLSKAFFDECDKLVFRIALPVFLFCKLAESDVSDLPSVTMIIFCVVAVFCAFTLISIGSHFFLPREKRGAFVHGAFRANFSIIGFVLADTMLDSTGMTALACATPFVITLSNILAVTTLTLNAPREKRESFGRLVLRVLKNIATNPIIISIIVALPFMLFGIKLPQIASNSVKYIENIATPLALLSLGSVNSGEKFKILPEAVIASTIKLIIIPIVFISSAILLGLRGNELAVVLILGTSPTAVSSYIMSKNMHSDGDLAKQIVLFTTLLCSFTIFVFAFVLRYIGLI